MELPEKTLVTTDSENATMQIDMKKQIALLEKYGVQDYSIEDGRIVINENLLLNSLVECDKDFLSGTTINGSLLLDSLEECDKDFLNGVTINGYLSLDSIRKCDKDFLSCTTINGSLFLNSLVECDKDFLRDTIINGSLSLGSLEECDRAFLRDTTINGGLLLDSLVECDNDFLRDTIINGCLYLKSLRTCDKDFLSGAIINGGLYLNSLEECDRAFLRDTTIKGNLHLKSLMECDEELLKSNVQRLRKGYNEEGGYCFFDGILSKVLSVKTTQGYTIYTTPFGFIAQKDGKTAHGETVRKAIQDLEFKFVAEKIKKEPIGKDTVITELYYRMITGACAQGVRAWKIANDITQEEMLAKDLLPILEATNAYGLANFKQLVTF